MRVTSNMKIQTSINNIGAQNERLAKLQEQASTGKKINRPSDDPIGMMNSIRLNTAKTSLEVYNNNLTQAKAIVNDSDTMVADTSRILTRFKELSVRGVNGTLSQGDRDIIAQEMNSLIEQLASDANYKNSEGFVFAGSKNTDKPFEVQMGSARQVGADGRMITNSSVIRVDYKGDRADILRNDSETTRMKVNMDGESAFMDVTGQAVYSTSLLKDPNYSPFDSNLKPGYFTIKGRDSEEIVKINGDESLQSLADKINKTSKITGARVVTESKGSRIVLEAREKGQTNQFALIEGATKFPRNITNALEVLGLTSKLQTINGVSDINQPLSTQFKDMRGGGFRINGQYIDVNAGKDSLTDVVEKINANVKNVNVKIVNGNIAIEGTGSLTIDNTTTNLFEKLGVPIARKISTAKIADAQIGNQPLAKNEWVKNGNFIINGQSIGITDAQTETLEDLMNKINGANIGATAKPLISSNGRFVITAAAVGNPPVNPPIADPNKVMTNIFDGTSEFLKSFEFSYQSSVLNVTPDTNVTTALVGVTAGSQFEINGKTFTVNSQDTLRSLAEKINFENLGARASIVADGAGVRFDLSPSGVKDDMHLANFKDVGTGNFFSKILMGNQIASKPSVTAPLVPGTLSSIGVFKNPLGNSFKINGIDIIYDPDTDSMGDIVAKINQNVSGVRASVNSNNKLVIDSTGPLTIVDVADPVTGVVNSNFVQKISIGDEKIADKYGNVAVTRSSENAQSLFDILMEIRDNLYGGNAQAIANNIDDLYSADKKFMGGLAKLDEGVNHATELREVFGSTLNQIDRTAQRNGDVELYLGKLIAANDEIDFEKLIVEYNTADLVYKTSLQIGAKVNQPTLLDFLG